MYVCMYISVDYAIDSSGASLCMQQVNLSNIHQNEWVKRLILSTRWMNASAVSDNTNDEYSLSADVSVCVAILVSSLFMILHQ